MNTPLDEFFAELEALHEKIYELCCRHRRNADKISDDLNKQIDEAIAEEYSQHIKVHAQELENAVTTELYVLNEIHTRTTPIKKRRWYWPWSFKKFGGAKDIDDTINDTDTANTLISEILARTEDVTARFLKHFTEIPAETSEKPTAASTETEPPKAKEQWE